MLRAGCEPDTSSTGSLLHRFLVNWTLSIEAQGVPLGGRVLRRDDLAAVAIGRPSMGANVATLLVPLFPEDAAEVMAALDAFYGFSIGEGSDAVYLFSPWPTPDLRAARLGPRGVSALDVASKWRCAATAASGAAH